MTEVFIVFIMLVIGALIGGVTNSLAIKMLFRPYEPKYIGNWKLPLTPGLIPKRREELATQLGRTVVDHLLTAEGLKKKLQQATFQQQVISWLQNECDRFINQQMSVKEVLASIGVYANETVIRQKIAGFTKNQYTQFMEESQNKTFRELVDEEWIIQSEQGIDELAMYLQKQLNTFVASDDARMKIGNLIEKFMEGQGFLGNMISSFLGNEGLADKIQPILVRYSESEETKELVKQLLIKEWNLVLDKPIGELESTIGREAVGDTLGSIISSQLPIENWLERSVDQFVAPIKSHVLYHVLPTVVSKLLESTMQRMDQLLEKLHLEEIVEKEVAGFPIERVEQLILNISRKEFKLITYLGALLGGFIGLIQGIIVIFLG